MAWLQFQSIWFPSVPNWNDFYEETPHRPLESLRAKLWEESHLETPHLARWMGFVVMSIIRARWWFNIIEVRRKFNEEMICSLRLRLGNINIGKKESHVRNSHLGKKGAVLECQKKMENVQQRERLPGKLRNRSCIRIVVTVSLQVLKRLDLARQYNLQDLGRDDLFRLFIPTAKFTCEYSHRQRTTWLVGGPKLMRFVLSFSLQALVRSEQMYTYVQWCVMVAFTTGQFSFPATEERLSSLFEAY